MSKLAQVGETLHRVKGYWSKPPEGRYIPFKEMAAYGAGGMGIHFMINLTYIFISAEFIPYMYGIDPIHGRNIATIVAILNLVFQPVFGRIMDNTHTKLGKFKPYIAFFAPVVCLVTVMATWTPQISGESVRAVYAYCFCIPTLLLGNTWLGVYNAMSGAMSPNTQERTDMLSPVGLVCSMAPTVLNVVVGPLREYYSHQGREYMAYRVIGLLFSAVALVLSLLILRYVKERNYITPEQKESVKFVDGIRQVLKNKPFLAWQASAAIGTLKLYMTTQMVYIVMFKYSEIYNRGSTIQAGLSLLTGFGATPAMLLVPLLTRKFSKKSLLVSAQFLNVAPLVVALLIGFDHLQIGMMSIVIMTIYGFLNSFNAGIGMVVNQAITADMYDYQQYKTGQRLEGFMGGVGAWMSGLVGMGLSYIPTFIQKSVGFLPNKPEFSSEAAYLPQNMAVINKWFTVAAIITLVATVLWALIMIFGYRLNEKEHRRIISIIKDRAVGDTFEGENAFLEVREELKNETVEEVRKEYEETR